MNPYEPLKPTEHIIGFTNESAPSPETMRKAGFKAADVICWTNKAGQMVLQNGDEFFKAVVQPENCECGEPWGHDWSPQKHGYKTSAFGWLACMFVGHKGISIDGQPRCKRCFWFMG